MPARSLGISVVPAGSHEAARRTSTAFCPSRSESSQNLADPLVASRWWKFQPSGSAVLMQGTHVALGTDWAMRITPLPAPPSPSEHRGGSVIAELGPSLEQPASSAAARGAKTPA